MYAVRQFNDALGGKIRGIQVNSQSQFYFLPGVFKNFGVMANYTHISLSLKYLTTAPLATTRTQSGTAVNVYALGALPQHVAGRLQRDVLLRGPQIPGARVGRVSQALRHTLPARLGHLRGQADVHYENV